MKVGFNAAAAAYTSALNRPSSIGGIDGAAAGGGFADMVKQAAQSAIGTVKSGEAATSKALSGNADMAQVVTAVSNAEVTLQAAVAVRDKVIQAYLDVIRMPI
ncbi:MAG: flagellar hook-basal body complex protein FliE [Rhodospirillales bacterium]|jgi:flagellar hook-basal body complex protein FliE